MSWTEAKKQNTQNVLLAIHAWLKEAIIQATKRISPHKYILQVLQKGQETN
jgi:hypothetical protein